MTEHEEMDIINRGLQKMMPNLDIIDRGLSSMLPQREHSTED